MVSMVIVIFKPPCRISELLTFGSENVTQNVRISDTALPPCLRCGTFSPGSHSKPCGKRNTGKHMSSIAMQGDLAVPMRDGARLFANLFRPAGDGSYPVIM